MVTFFDLLQCFKERLLVIFLETLQKRKKKSISRIKIGLHVNLITNMHGNDGENYIYIYILIYACLANGVEGSFDKERDEDDESADNSHNPRWGMLQSRFLSSV